MLKNRIATAVIGAPLTLFFVFLGSKWFFIFLLLISYFALFEYFYLLQKMGASPLLKKFFYFAFAVIFFLLLFTYQGWYTGHAILLIVFIVLLNIFYLIIFPDVKLWELALILWGIIYIGGFMAYLLALRQLPEGLSYLLLLIFGIWASDTGAYFIGLSFGKHRLAPRISPKKSLEGAAGGVVVSAIAIETLIKFSPFPLIPTGHGLLWGAIISVLGQLGDLIESAYKREAQVKDSGVILPGHGGILDRLDSLLFAAPVFYYAVLIFL